MKTTKVDSRAAIYSILALLVCSALSTQELPAQFRSLTIHANGNVRMLVVDPQGRRLGYDFREKKYYEEIPGGNIGAAGIDIVTEEGGEEDPSQANPIDAIIPEPVDGDYEIILTGGRLGFYDLNVLARHLTKPITNIADGGIIDSGKTATFRFTYDFNDRSRSIIKKVVGPSTLRQDLGNSYKLKLLGDQGFHKELSNILDSYEKHLSKKDTLKAVKELEKFQDRITKEYDKGTKSKDKRFVTTDAWEILYSDAQYIVEHLIQLPPKPIGTLLQQIDELKAEVLEQQGKKNIGGSLLIKSLTLFADKARTHLQQGDSAQAALSVRLFQLLVDETHELTEAVTAKKKPLPSVFVKDEAYVQLHYRANYILEALPEPRVDLHQHRLQTVDKELLKELESLKGMIEQK